MKLSSNLTALRPAAIILSATLLLLVSNMKLIGAILPKTTPDDSYGQFYAILIAFLLLSTGVVYYFLRVVYLKSNGMYTYAISIFIFVMLIANLSKMLVGSSLHRLFSFETFIISAFLFVFLYSGFYLLKQYNHVFLINQSLHYTNLLGLKGEVPLTDITILEERMTRWGMVSFIFGIKKLCITFVDENSDEYEIEFIPSFRIGQKEVFWQLLQTTHSTGNTKVRTY